jgi:hypothetical protein
VGGVDHAKNLISRSRLEEEPLIAVGPLHISLRHCVIGAMIVAIVLCLLSVL